MIPTFEAQREAWSCPPVDDVGYMSSAELLKLSDDSLRLLILNMEANRYQGWRNYENGWRAGLHLDDTEGARILDFGCGTGLEGLQYARDLKNLVDVADIYAYNVALAQRVIRLFTGTIVPGIILGPGPQPAAVSPRQYDVIHAAGVLHHIPNVVEVVETLSHWLDWRGQLRVMMYSDRGWRIATGTEPPFDVTDHSRREKFVHYFDSVGDWADWYDADRLEQRFGKWFKLTEFQYITHDDRFCTAILTKRD
jgi:SAM-dependent methyltransferase